MSELLQFILANETPFQSKSRLTSLYSDFSRIKTTNPEGYLANVNSWTSALQHACSNGTLLKSQCSDGALSLNFGKNLENELVCEGLGKPVALPSVVAENVSQQAWISAQDFKDSKSSILQSKSWLSFHIPTAFEIAQWGLRQVGLNFSQNRGLTGQYVLLPNVENVSQKLVLYLSHNPPPSELSRIHSLETFTKAFASILSPSTDSSSLELSEDDIRIVLIYLSRDKNFLSISISEDTDNKMTIKLPSSSKGSSDPVSDNDIRIAQLKTLHQALTDQVSALEERVSSLDEAARTAISSTGAAKLPSTISANDKSRALRALRQKRVASSTLEKRQASLDQVDEVLQKIDDAASNVEIVSAIENGAGVLKDLNKQIGGIERVENVMDRLQDEMANVDEMGAVLAESGRNQVDEGEIEDELEALQAEQKSLLADEEGAEGENAEAKQSRLNALPAVPANDPEPTAMVEKAQLSQHLEYGDQKSSTQQEAKEGELEQKLSLLALDEPQESAGAKR